MSTIKGRPKSSIKLTTIGKNMIDVIRKEKAWTQHKLAEQAFVSSSTLKRFVSGQPVSPGNFKAICEVLGIDEWQSLIDWQDVDSVTKAAVDELSKSANQDEEPQLNQGICLTGVFASAQKIQIEMVVKELKELLLDGRAKIRSVKGENFDYSCYVSGVYSVNQQLEIEAILEHIKQLLLECTITFR
jgi:transcriptional regulator with XRE-family HTH domain